MESISDEITATGEEIAKSLDQLAGALSKQTFITEFNELSHSLLTVVSKTSILKKKRWENI
jgi:hypothetical protein